VATPLRWLQRRLHLWRLLHAELLAYLLAGAFLRGGRGASCCRLLRLRAHGCSFYTHLRRGAGKAGGLYLNGGKRLLLSLRLLTLSLLGAAIPARQNGQLAPLSGVWAWRTWEDRGVHRAALA